ncbi:titin-like [Phyllobates terribilis]|uniref:titin-like n=1 Tax=Phyllobates terribilis TaxID=111132 RepID=UPI003CCB1D85
MLTVQTLSKTQCAASTTNMYLLLLVVSLLSNMVSEAGIVKVRRGDPAVLQCEADPGDTLLSVTWKLRLYNSSCVISYKIEEDNTKASYSSCSPRMRSDHLSLTINNTEISDEGTYTCQVVNDNDTITGYFLLKVLAEPSTFLKVSSDGSPECGAIGGNPPAEISWIPHSDDINTTKLEDLDLAWSVISTIRRSGINGASVTCVVSHPTFVSPWKGNITLSSVQPTTYLKLNSNGSPECGAISGNPSAEISWIPHSDDINTTKLEDPDGTWSVISTFGIRRTSRSSVTCVVSHSTFVNPWKENINLNSMVRVRRGDPTVLQCEADPGDTLLSVTWKLHLYNSSCVISYKIEEDNTKTSYSSCSTRMRSDHLSLTINNTEMCDEGTYTCEVANDEDTFFRKFSLKVLVQPFPFLKLSSDGFPQCEAIGGNPPAEISWIPHLDDINTTKLEDPDRMWSVISTIMRSGINRTSVTCVVSHPTFVNSWKAEITLSSARPSNLRLRGAELSSGVPCS